MREVERQKILGVVTGEPRATDEFIAIWHPRIHRWVSRHSWIRPVDDVAQQVWYHLLENGWHRLLQWEGLFSDDDWHEHGLASFLRRVTINKARDLERAAQRQLPASGQPFDIIDEDGPVGVDPQKQSERERLAAIFESCFQRLQSRDQVNLSMWHEGYSDAEIADRLDMTPNNVAQRRFQALPGLRYCLQQKLPEYFRRD